uniref:Uncharacterized protein n=2 Tax=Physcomitrium patens TaxID=3218 RepID=A0A7I3Z9S8_PHYPA
MPTSISHLSPLKLLRAWTTKPTTRPGRMPFRFPNSRPPLLHGLRPTIPNPQSTTHSAQPQSPTHSAQPQSQSRSQHNHQALKTVIPEFVKWGPYQMLSLPADLLTVRRIVTRASTLPTLRDSSFTGLSTPCPAKAVECIAVAPAMSAHTFPNGGSPTEWEAMKWRYRADCARRTQLGGGPYSDFAQRKIMLGALL